METTKKTRKMGRDARNKNDISSLDPYNHLYHQINSMKRIKNAIKVKAVLSLERF